MLRVALPNKGQLADPALSMLKEAGYLLTSGSRELVVQDPDNDAEFFFLRPRDIAIYVGEGTLDVGITGRDLLLDANAAADELMQLGFGPSTFRLATTPDLAGDIANLDGKRIATSYPGILNGWLASKGLKATVVPLDGAVENAVRLGVADAVADVVATGTTLRMAGLTIVGEPLLHSEALLIRRSGIPLDAATENFIRRLQGVIVARTYVMVDYDCRVELVERACAITPGIESPTLSPLKDPQWVAVRAMVPKREVHKVMDDLYDLGARGILVTEIAACRL